MPEAINCDPAAIAAASKCFCFPEKEANAAIAYLLAQIAGDTSTPSELAAKAKCYCFNKRTSEAVITYLLCQIASGGSGSCGSQTGDVPPTGVVTPDFVGQLYIENPGPMAEYWYSTGLTAADWTAIAGGVTGDLSWGPGPTTPAGLLVDNVDSLITVINTDFGSAFTELTFNSLVGVIANLQFTNITTITLLAFPNLLTVGANVEAATSVSLIEFDAPKLTTATNFNFSNNTALTTIDLQSLVSIGNNFYSFGSPLLASLNLDSLQTVGNNINISNAVNNLTVISLPSLISVVGALAATSCTILTDFNAPNLVSVGDVLNLNDSQALSTLSLSSLVSVGNGLTASGNNTALLASLDLHSLVTVVGNFSFINYPSLASVNTSSWVPTDGTSIDVSVCALTATSVELILRRCVLAGVTTCSIDVSGGTNAGILSLSAQGQADAATLGAQLTANP